MKVKASQTIWHRLIAPCSLLIRERVPLEDKTSLTQNDEAIPILGCVLLTFNVETGVSAEVTNLTSTVKTNLKSEYFDFKLENDEPLVVAIPLVQIFNFINTLSFSDELTLTLKEKHVMLSHKKRKLKVNHINSDSFPFFDYQLHLNEILSIETNSLKEAIDNGKYAIASNDERAFFNALNFNFTKECIEITATNGKVLFNEVVPIVGGEVIEGKEFSALVPRDEVNLLIRLINHISEDTLKVCMTGNRLYINSNEISLILGLFNFSYPVVSHLIAQDPHTIIHVDRTSLISAVKGVSSTRMVREFVELSMVIKEDGIYLSMKNDLCQGEDEISVNYFNGVPIQLIINYKYLLNTLYSLIDDDIQLDFCLEPVKTIKFFEKDTDLKVRLIAPFMLEPYIEQV